MIWLTPAQVAERTGFRPSTLANWRSLGIGPAFVKVGTRIRYDDDAVSRWQEAQ